MDITAETIWTAFLSVASAVVLISNAIEKIVKAHKTAKAPELKQNERINTIEQRLDSIEEKLANDNARLCDIKKGDRATQRALIALLDHGIDGNNLEQMKNARDELNNYLIEK